MKTKISLLFAIALISVIPVVAQNHGYAILSDYRTSQPFHYISISGEMNVKIVQHETPAVAVVGSGYQLGNTITMLRGDTLFVYQTNIRQRDDKTYVTIFANGITHLEATGKTKVVFSKLFNQDYLTVSAKDGAQIRLDVRSRKVQATALNSTFEAPSLD